MRMNHRIKRILFLSSVSFFLFLNVTSAQAASVLMLQGNDGDSNFAVFFALQNGGHTVTPGPAPSAFTGTLDLTPFDAIVILNSFDWMAGGGRMPLGGVTALIKYVASGGGIVTGERFAWWAMSPSSGRQNAGVEAVMPVTLPTFNSATSTTYTQDTPDEIINNGLPGSFTFNLRDNQGIAESSFDARTDATVFYRSSNGGGRADSPGIVGWNFLTGKVLSFSSQMTTTELATDEYKQLLVNAVNWVARASK